MAELTAGDFSAFFEAIHGYGPFPWQRMLVERVAEGGWPEGIDLPTASGKTACIDAAVFLMALGEREGRLAMDHPARRRIFFVVDRRIVVDEAYERAKRLAKELADATGGVVKQVADALRSLAGEGAKEPLVVSRLRGGTLKDERWRSNPAQPAVVTSTVDQIGSRLLFRSYGASPRLAPIDAALTACDSMILLDEAHCAVPFMQTARAVARYAGEAWAEGQAVAPPLRLSILSATLPGDVKDVFPGEDREAALEHEELDRRRRASKPAVLAKPVKDRAALASEIVKRATAWAKDGPRRIAVMVNRVATAADVAAGLEEAMRSEKAPLDADVLLLTGRMRPYDRDQLVERWSPKLKAGSEVALERSVILVTTQCLEVGADFSFEALVTECASLDALRQRFGRVNRFGDPRVKVDAAVLVQKPDIAAKADDPIYGEALKETWKWLSEQSEEGTFDFGIEAVERKLPARDSAEHEQLMQRLNAPSPDAPVMLPAHVDFFCQTSPRPAPDPDVSVFLHGPREDASPEARVVFRADLPREDQADWEDAWKEAVGMLPPASNEALTLPLSVLRRWLAGRPVAKDAAGLGDVEGQGLDGEEGGRKGDAQRFVIWRGRRDSRATTDVRKLRPGDLVVVRAEVERADDLGPLFCRPPGVPLDIAEQAYPEAKGRHVLRLTPAIMAEPDHRVHVAAKLGAMKELIEWASDEDREARPSEDQFAAMDSAIAAEKEDEAIRAGAAEWWKASCDVFKAKFRSQPHPAGGLVLVTPLAKAPPVPPDLEFGDEDDALSAVEGEVPLKDHATRVRRFAKRWAKPCLPDSDVKAVAVATELHDVGKADPRFQEVLHGTQTAAAMAILSGNLLAKSGGTQLPPRQQQRVRDAADLPKGFRHEMLSMQLAEMTGDLPEDPALRELVLHLIASHHGHGRPFAPVVIDEEWPEVRFDGITLLHEQRREMVPPHRLDSGVAERFWTLTRRYGWWGLAYLEAMVRLADHAASAAEAADATQEKQEVGS